MHVFTHGGDYPLAFKPHCRYGTGIFVKEETLTCYVTGRQAKPVEGIGQAPIVSVFRSAVVPKNHKLKLLSSVTAQYGKQKGQKNRSSENFPNLNLPDEGSVIVFKVNSPLGKVNFSIWEDIARRKDKTWWENVADNQTIEIGRKLRGRGLYVVTTDDPQETDKTYTVEIYAIVPGDGG